MATIPSPDIVSTAAGVIGSVINILGGIGDAVKAYPIRTVNTFNKIVAEIKGYFVPPVDEQMALDELKEIDRWIKVSQDKKTSGEASAAVMDTYILMLQELKVSFAMYLQGKPFQYPQYNPGGKAFTGVDLTSVMNSINVPGYTGGNTNPGQYTAGVSKNPGAIVMIVLAVIVVIALANK